MKDLIMVISITLIVLGMVWIYELEDQKIYQTIGKVISVIMTLCKDTVFDFYFLCTCVTCHLLIADTSLKLYYVIYGFSLLLTIVRANEVLDKK